MVFTTVFNPIILLLTFIQNKLLNLYICYMTYTIQKILVSLFIIIALAFAYFIYKLSVQSKTEWVQHKHCNAKVIDIYNGYKGKPNYQIMLLADSQRFTIPKAMLNKLKIGDSVLKHKDSSFYLFTLLKTNEKIKAEWQ
jgi:hypothetical protein